MAANRILYATLLAGLLVGSVLFLPGGTSHNTPTGLPGEQPGQFDGGLDGFKFHGPLIEEFDPEPPCNGRSIMDRWGDWESNTYPETNARATPTSPYNPPANGPHIGHIYGVQSIERPFVWLKENSTQIWHMFNAFNPPNGWEGNKTNYAAPTIMLGPDGWAVTSLNGTVVDTPQAPDIWVQDFHAESTYCVYGRPGWDPTGPWLFIGTGFIHTGEYYWPPDDTSYDYAATTSLNGGGGSALDLELYYKKYYNEHYGQPGGPELQAEVEDLMFVSSLEKLPAIRSFFSYDVSTDKTTNWPYKGDPADNRKATEETDNCPTLCENIWHLDLATPAVNDTYDYEYNPDWDTQGPDGEMQGPTPVVQEHWVDFDEAAIRYGWPQRPDIENNTPDPIIGYKWFFDTDPRPDVDTTLQYRDCFTPGALCPEDFNLPNPHEKQDPLYPVYYQLLNDSYEPESAYRTDETNKGYYEVCLLTYTATFRDLHDQNGDKQLDDFFDATGTETPDGIPDLLQTGGANSLERNENHPHGSYLCQTVEVENLVPNARFKEPNPPGPQDDQRVRTFVDMSYDPDGWPPCLDRWIWDMDGDIKDLSIGEVDPTFDPLQPTYTFMSGGTKRIQLTTGDCNGGVSEPFVKYIHVPPNEPPVFEEVPPLIAFAGQRTCFTIDAYDPEGYPLSYITHDGNLPPGMTPATPPTTNNAFPLCWTPSPSQLGLKTFRFTAEDNLKATTDYLVLMRVLNPDVDSDGDGAIDVHDPCAGGSPACDLDVQFACPAGSEGCQVDWEALCISAVGASCAAICPPDLSTTCTIDYDTLCPTSIGVHCERLAKELGRLGLIGNGQSRMDARLRAAADADAKDTDGDGLVDRVDNCPTVPNRMQADLDTDDVGDLCDLDRDGDGVVQVSGDPAVILDNCPSISNPAQDDSDRDGIGDACDVDSQSGRQNLARLEGRVTVADCDDCASRDIPVGEPESRSVGSQGVLSILGGIALLVLISMGLTVWAVRKWRD